MFHWELSSAGWDCHLCTSEALARGCRGAEAGTGPGSALACGGLCWVRSREPREQAVRLGGSRGG